MKKLSNLGFKVKPKNPFTNPVKLLMKRKAIAPKTKENPFLKNLKSYKIPTEIH